MSNFFLSFIHSCSSMLCSLCNTVVIQKWNINGGGNHSRTKTQPLCFLILQKNQNPSLIIKIRCRPITSSSSINISSSTNQTSFSSSSFVVSYLMNSCGLSEDRAISASKELHFETSSKPDKVLTFLENNGFSKPHISRIISGRPRVLLSDPFKTLKPKLEFFNSIGLSGLELAKLISKDVNILLRSLENHIIPTFAFLKSILHTDKNVIIALKRSTWVLLEDPEKRIVPNIGVLRDQRVPESNISLLLNTQPRALLTSADRFKEIVEKVKGMDFDPKQTAFVAAIHALTSMSKSNWEAKLNVFRKLGLSEDEIRTAFRKQPKCMTVSEKKIMAIMNFFGNQMGYDPSFIAEHPHILTYSLEKRIIPRCMVIRILVSKGLSDNFCLTSVLTMGGKSFLERYVIKFEQEIPELKDFRGQLDM